MALVICAILIGIIGPAYPAAAGVGVWTREGLANLRVNAVTVDPTNHQIVYAGTNGQGIFRSTNGGQTWAQINSGLANLFVNDIVVSPADPTIVMIATGQGALVGDPYGGVYRSTNRGDAWTHRLDIAYAGGLAIAPQNAQIVYVAGAPPVYRSTNGGVDWQPVFPAPGVFPDVDMFDIAVSPADPNIVLVGGNTEGGTGFVFRTTNAGQTWNQVHTGHGYFSEITFSPTDSQLVYFGGGGGVWRSRDAGVTWTNVFGEASVLSVLANPLNGNILYAGTSDRGVYRTANAGDSFHALRDGMGDRLVSGLGIDLAQPQTLWAGTGDGVWAFTIAAQPPPFQTVATWYFAEGSTAAPFDTWYLIQNPTTNQARVRFIFQLPDGATITRQFDVRPRSRFSLFANEILPNQALSARIEADQPVFAERSMFVGFDGHVVTGIAAPSERWLFAEGSTQPPFHTWLLLQNPNPEAATATITYLVQDGATQTQTVALPPTSRTSIFVNEVLPNVAFSTQVNANRPIIAERAMYRFPGNAATGVAGVTAAAANWYFAEGHTNAIGLPTDTWLLLQNPQATAVPVTITLFQEIDAEPIVLQQTLPPATRQSYFLNQFIRGSFGIHVQAGAEIIAERSMFFGTEPRGAHATVGSPALATVWNLAEGSTAPPFDQIIAIMNPHDQTATATLEFLLETGEVITRDFEILPESKLSIVVDVIVPSTAVSTVVRTSLPTVVERTMFMRKPGGIGGHNTIGIRQ
jgi:photosystem II stability/assembly factor-like uncharacterized protein